MKESMSMEEIEKCKNNPYYFMTTYCVVIDKEGNSHKFTTHLTEEEFNNRFNELQNGIFI